MTRVPRRQRIARWSLGEERGAGEGLASGATLVSRFSGGPAVLGIPVDRWLCVPAFRRVCRFQSLLCVVVLSRASQQVRTNCCEKAETSK